MSGTPVAYPAALPCPISAAFQPAERRRLSGQAGPRQSSVFQRDRGGAQSLFFIFKNETLLQAWRDWYEALDGAWFAAEWPLPQGGVGVRRFVGGPTYSGYLPKHRGFGVTIDSRVRGAGVLPQIDPYAALAILAIGAGNTIADSSFLARPLTGGGSLYPGSSLIDVSTGRVQVPADSFYGNYLGTSEWTLEWRLAPTALPVGDNNRVSFFSGFVLGLQADGSITNTVAVGSTSYAIGAPAGAAVVGQQKSYAMTRTNNGAASFVTLFAGDAEPTFSPYFNDDGTQNGLGSDFGYVMGYDIPTHAIFTYLRLLPVNRYPGATGPVDLPTSI